MDQPASAGCNHLIRDGATLVRNVQDILDELEGTILEGISFSQKQQKQIINSGNSQSSLPLLNLTQEEQSVYSILKDGDILSLEEMMGKLA